MTRFSAAAALLALAALPLTAAAEDDRPVPPAVGIGVGIAAPQGTFAMNTASARIKVSDDVVLEPGAGLDIDSSKTAFDAGGTTGESVSSTRDISLGTQARIRTVSDGPIDFQVLGGAGVSLIPTAVDPDNDATTNNGTTTDTTTFGLSWGVGLCWFVSEHFSISGDATNPLVTFTQSKSFDEASDSTTTGTGVGLNVEWAPGVRVMGHIWF